MPFMAILINIASPSPPSDWMQANVHLLGDFSNPLNAKLSRSQDGEVQHKVCMQVLYNNSQIRDKAARVSSTHVAL